jgi:hypothetical protein
MYSTISKAALVGNAIAYGLDTNGVDFAFSESGKYPGAKVTSHIRYGMGDVSAGVAPLAQKERAGNKKNEPVIRNV